MASIAAWEYQLASRTSVQPAADTAGKGGTDMLDLIYLATGAAFLYVCVLYAFACDNL